MAEVGAERNENEQRVVTMNGNLTPRQKRFVDEYLIDLNATQAAIRSGYSPRTANEQGARLLAHVSIQAEIAKRQQKLQQRTEVTQERVIRELAAIGFADIADYAKVLVSGDVTAVMLTPTANIEPHKRAAISSIKEGANGIEVKLNDKLRALELIGKHLGMFSERKDEESDVEDLTPLAALLKGASPRAD